MNRIILDLCGGTGSWSEPYRQAGYDVRLVTLPEYDVLTYEPPPGVHGVLAAPPCTHLSIASARYWKAKDADGRTENALAIVRACLRIIQLAKPKWWVMENPEGRLASFIGKPVYKFLQSDFGAPYKKRTCLWGNFSSLFVMGPFNENPGYLCKARNDVLPVLPKGYGKGIDQNKRAARRSMLPPAFAESFFLANQ